MNRNELKSLGISSGLILINVALMWVFAFTVLSRVNDLLFGTFFFAGVIVYGLMLSGGVWLAKRGVRSDDLKTAVIGTGIIQVAYGIFGAGIIGFFSPEVQAILLGATAAVTTVIALGAGLLVFGTNHDFSNWDRYSNYLFLGVLGVSFIGSFSAAFTVIAFVLALTGFIVYLVHEIYMVKTRPGRPIMNAVGLYTAYMGVFVQILQIIVELLLRRE